MRNDDDQRGAATLAKDVAGRRASETLSEKIAERRFTIGVMGLGYVGLPLALTALRAGFPVIGFDVNAQLVAQLNAGETVFSHVATDGLDAALADGRFRATDDFSSLSTPDAILIAVPTPLDRHREPDLRFVEASARQIADALRPGQLVVLESTTWPGTTAEVVKPILEATGLRAGRDFFLAFSPEREDPGNERYRTATIPKVVGADDVGSRLLADALYRSLVIETVPVSSAATAEAVKLTENIFRSVNIALVNELKVIFDKMGIDVWEVVEAAKSKPFGYMPFYPGPGLGGHCVPIDPFYLTWRAREFDVSTRFIELAGQINTAMPYYVVDRLAEALDAKSGRGLKNARILLVGMAYKKNIEDTRESPSLKLLELLERRGAVVDYHDPYVPMIPPTRRYPDFTGRESVAPTPEAVRSYDAVLVSTDHDAIDWSTVVAHASLLVDTRNVCERKGLTSDAIVKA